MKKIAVFLLVSALFSLCFVLTSCKKKEENNYNSSTGEPVVSVDSSGEKTKSDFIGVTFTDKTVNYNGSAHTITVNGAPDFAAVEYTGNGPFTDTGEYIITAKISAENYNTLTLSAKLTIKRIDFTGVTFADGTFGYDGEYHSLIVSGNITANASIVYTSDVEGVTNSAKDVGEYNITAIITEKNHNTLTLHAVLKIMADDEERALVFSEDGNLFFQNAVDGNKFYFYNATNGSIVKVSGDNVADVIPYKLNGVMYISKTPFFSAIKAACYSGNDVEIQTILTQTASYIQVSGNVVYFAVNGLTQNKSGIYKADFSGDDPITTLLSAGKAKYLKLCGAFIYFADGNNGYKLSKINLSDENQNRILVVDEKINNLTVGDNALYYTVNDTFGNYIEKYVISSGTRRKLTSDAGESLTVIGDELYYVIVDKFNTLIKGNGIYKVPVSPFTDNNSTGARVIDGGEYGVCSLAAKDNYLYYYDVEGYKLIKYNLTTKTGENLLRNFVKPEDPTPITKGSKIAEYNGNIYYLDLWDLKTLHCYNPITNTDYRVTTEKAEDFAIIGDNLYINSVSYLVNNASYVINLKTGGEAVKVNDYSAFDICFDGTYIYYIEENALGVKTAIHKCLPDGSADEVVYDKGVTNLKYAGGYLYFIDDYSIHSFNLDTMEDKEIQVNGKSIHTTVFDTDGTYIYYRDMYGIAWGSKRLARCRLDGSDDVKIVTAKTDPTSILYKDGYVYYYTDTATSASSNGLYRVRADAADTAGEELLLCNGEFYAAEFCILGDDIYFVDYLDQLRGNCHLYVMRKTSDKPVLVK